MAKGLVELGPMPEIRHDTLADCIVAAMEKIVSPPSI